MHRRRLALWTFALLSVLTVAGLAFWAASGADHPVLWTVRVVATFPHDPSAFTQGLTIHNGRLYEGTGQYGSSSIRRVNLTSGQVEQLMPLPPTYFGEGIAVLGNRAYQLTWQNETGVIYDLESLRILQVFQYEGEGWGLTHDDRHLIVSDGTARLQFWDPDSLATIRQLNVQDRGTPVTRLNELEYIEGEIWANVWYQDRIARISPATGDVLGWIDLGGLYSEPTRGSEDVLNGIAYDRDADRVFVTGKNWPHLYEIELTAP
jgi:glutamine cyclotransferase